MKRRATRLDASFAALSDPTRRRIVQRLTRGDASVGDIAEPFDMTLPAVSKHIAVLERAGMVTRWREGPVHRVRLERDALDAATAWLSRTRHDWERRLDRLEEMLAKDGPDA